MGRATPLLILLIIKFFVFTIWTWCLFCYRIFLFAVKIGRKVGIMELVVALKGVSDIGKTGTLKELARILIANYGSSSILPSYQNHIENLNTKTHAGKDTDICLVFEVEGIIAAVDTMGDPKYKLDDYILKDRLYKYKELGCSLIFCACRSKGYTFDDVRNFSDANKFHFVWTSPYYQEIGTYPTANLNEVKAKNLLQLANTVLGIKIKGASK